MAWYSIVRIGHGRIIAVVPAKMPMPYRTVKSDKAVRRADGFLF